MKLFLLPFEPEHDGIELDGEAFHYLIRVRRHKAGDEIPAVSPLGRRFAMTVAAIGKASCAVTLLEAENENPPADTGPTRIFLFPALTKGRKMDLAIRQAVEAGAAEIRPVHCEFSQVPIPAAVEAEKKLERWIRIAREARQQCGAAAPTEVHPPATLEDGIRSWNSKGPLLFLHEKPLDTFAGLHRHLAAPVDYLAIMAGPEGGFSPKEVQLLLDRGGHPVFLGDRVLRAETAILYGLAAASTIIRERSEWKPA